MKRIGLKIGLLVLMVLVAVNMIACAPVHEAHAGEAAILVAPALSGDSCLAPASEVTRARCAEWERQALAATVRLEIRVFSLSADGMATQIDGSSGHAAIKDGRYLVTHNHYAVSLVSESTGTISRLTLLKANGEVILSDTPLNAFQIVYEDAQTLVLDFGAQGGVGLFAAQGMPSATFSQVNELSLKPGDEVAQIDWDGATSHVDWVRVAVVQAGAGTPYLELDNYVLGGSSGGGVYFNGVHIANNWSHSTDRSVDTGEIMRQYSTAALNSAGIAGTAVQ